jgi:hypothetical protein
MQEGGGALIQTISKCSGTGMILSFCAGFGDRKSKSSRFANYVLAPQHQVERIEHKSPRISKSLEEG